MLQLLIWVRKGEGELSEKVWVWVVEHLWHVFVLVLGQSRDLWLKDRHLLQWPRRWMSSQLLAVQPMRMVELMILL